MIIYTYVSIADYTVNATFNTNLSQDKRDETDERGEMGERRVFNYTFRFTCVHACLD